MNINAYLRKLDKSTLVMTCREWLASALDWIAERTAPGDDPLMTPGVTVPPPGVETARHTVPISAVHPRRAHLHVRTTFSERAADKLAASMGSWTYIGCQTLFIALWMTLNAVAWINHWDPAPFILLNLIFSIQASYAAPILQLAGNRQSARDRARDDTEAREVDELLSMNRRQLEILRGQDEQMARQQQTIELLHQLIAEQRRGKGHSAA